MHVSRTNYVVIESSSSAKIILELVDGSGVGDVLSESDTKVSVGEVIDAATLMRENSYRERSA